MKMIVHQQFPTKVMNEGEDVYHSGRKMKEAPQQTKKVMIITYNYIGL